jgi:hypothetical protein
MGYLLLVLFVHLGQTPRVIASTADWSITAEQFDAIVKTFPEQDQPRYVVPEYRRGLVNELVRIQVLCAEARKNGLDIGTDFESQRNYYQQYGRDVAATITDDDVHSYYDAHTYEMTLLAISQILILNGSSPISPYPQLERLPYKEAEDKAKEVKALLDKGGDWKELAEKYSQDVASKDRDGLVGYVRAGSIEKPLENALFSLKVGEISDVIGSSYGFHILRLEEIKVTPFEDVQAGIRQKLVTDEVNRRIEAKVKAGAVTIDESFFQ